MIKGSGHSPVNKFCEFCKKEFQVIYKSRHQTCCSLKCSSLYGWSLKEHRKTFTKPCDVCGKIMETRPDRVEDGRGKYCSKDCYVIAMKRNYYPHIMSEESREKLSEIRREKLNPAYIHGNSPGAKRYQGYFSRLIKGKVLKRDSYKCQQCFIPSGSKFVVHHINVDNLVVWCRSCHATYHRLKEWKEGRRSSKS